MGSHTEGDQRVLPSIEEYKEARTTLAKERGREWHESRGGGKSQIMEDPECHNEEPGLFLKGTKEPSRSSEQGRDRVTFVP